MTQTLQVKFKTSSQGVWCAPGLQPCDLVLHHEAEKDNILADAMFHMAVRGSTSASTCLIAEFSLDTANQCCCFFSQEKYIYIYLNSFSH